ncbi:DUF2339 domain-containing protein [Pedobacter changchengzhani]|uniref:DUF2339 domain-containing protein n=1 Tax=Pedobacter changchengzhani TaxID=2529274 RepID=A0A4R5MME5_9SPHI|nr:DUF2339 domain-containing protein [Pedobacter changchengzhani]TDG36844.1 DUF2339 domain-containing protein [Pedobacter changchengzhani]
MNNSEQLNLLLIKLENLLLRQQGFESEIETLRNQVRQLQSGGAPIPAVQKPIEQKPLVVFPERNTPPSFANQNTPPPVIAPPTFAQPAQQPTFTNQFKRENLGKSSFEKFIGENLINKIGILILIIGVAIGANYAIENGMVSPLTRIILGYLVGAGLMGFAIKLKAKYESFSAVLLSGAIAIMYFITYAAFDFYKLIPQAMAFTLMVIFTSFTIVAAIKYNKQVIAHIGLVGAYAVPFLLSNGSGQAGVLFTYIAIINIGILILSFKKYWKPLFYASFGLTWIIFLAWRLDLPSDNNFFSLSLLFSTLFFFIFYITNLAYKVSKKEVFGLSDVVLLLLNSFIYYGIGYFILADNKHSVELLGLFTLANAVVHFVVAVIIYKRKLADRNLFYLILAMVITFITMAVPVQLDGGWVTIFWTVEAAVLFYLARVKNIAIYEKLSFPLIFLAFFSLAQDWLSYADYYGNVPIVKPILNVGFLTGCIFIASFIWMLKISSKETEKPAEWIWIRQILTYAIPSILVFVTYITFSIEIAKHFNNLFELTKINTTPNAKAEFANFVYNYNYEKLKTALIFIYTLFFVSALTILNLKKLRNNELALANVALNLLVIVAFLTFGLWNLSELRDAYKYADSSLSLNQSGYKEVVYFKNGAINIYIRYISIAFLGLLVWSFYKLSKSDLLKKWPKTAFDYIFYITLLWILSSELVNVVSLSYLEGSYKLGLSVLWGAFSLFLICIGLWKNKKHLRIGAIILFAITLIKLFIYDVSYLDTIAKTALFIFLGVLLLFISFLYNKYKHLIIENADAED